MTQMSQPFEDARQLALREVEPDEASAEIVREGLRSMGRETDFGKLGEAAQWLARWQRRAPPRIESGTAPLSAIAAQVGAEIRVMELALDVPTGNIAEAPAMSERDCAATIAYGFEAVAGEPDLLALGVSGAGIGTAAAAVASALFGGTAEYWVRPGPGTPNEMTAMRAEIVNKALTLHRADIGDPLMVLACLGGRELAACVGAILAARLQNVPVVLDGFATTIAASVVHAINPDALSHVIAAHETRRPAHQAALERIGMKPMIDMEFQTGGGLGSTTAIGLLGTACAPFIAQPEAG